ncbi:hypothetical protein MLD38_018024 [Melastoma candidum]|uniref:Uncharacterized protein n=1 Tax=Melastoma candidum TaxID=119954 RepID=A0ACB9QSQ0_9MYRT|nr:hypothetical protein MLD38_018024 [Melastoma candidum]
MGQATGKVSSTSPEPPTSAAKPETPPVLHRSDADEDDDNVRQLQECSSLYLALQDCLVNSDRNWKSCQREVQALKACNEARKKIAAASAATTTTRK